jgi:hypothetical protein
MLDKLDARLLFLPQLEMAVDGRRDDEVRAVLSERRGKHEPIYTALRKESSREPDAPCDGCKVNHVAMHETLVVPVCARQTVEEKPFMRENYDEGALLSIKHRMAILNAPLRFFFVTALSGAPSGTGMGPTSSSLSSSSCGADGGFISVSSEVSAPGPFRARLPRMDASCSESDMVCVFPSGGRNLTSTSHGLTDTIA